MQAIRLAALWGGLLFLAGCGEWKPVAAEPPRRTGPSDEVVRMLASPDYQRQVRKQERLKQEWIARGSPPSNIQR